MDLRGFGETATLNTLVLVDGRRVNQADLSGTDWSQIPLRQGRAGLKLLEAEEEAFFTVTMHQEV